MFKQHYNIDPVSRDLNNYLAAQDQHDITMGRLQAIAEKEFCEMNYLEIIEYDNNYTDLEFVFDYVIAGKIDNAKKALSNFMQTVKDSYINKRTKELEEDEENQRQADAAFEKYYAENPPYWC